MTQSSESATNLYKGAFLGRFVQDKNGKTIAKQIMHTNIKVWHKICLCLVIVGFQNYIKLSNFHLYINKIMHYEVAVSIELWYVLY